MTDRALVAQIKSWLQEEVESNQDVATARDGNLDPVTSDGTDDIIYGRWECAQGLLNQITKWEAK